MRAPPFQVLAVALRLISPRCTPARYWRLKVGESLLLSTESFTNVYAASNAATGDPGNVFYVRPPIGDDLSAPSNLTATPILQGPVAA